MYRYRLIPGIAIVSNMHWKLGTIIVMGLAVALVLYLATQSPRGAANVKSALRGHARGTSQNVSLPVSVHPPFKTEERRQHQQQQNFSLRQHQSLLRPRAKRRRLNAKEKQWVLNQHNQQCARCTRPILDERLCDLDHSIPLWATALPWVNPEIVQDIGGFQVLCLDCHRLKTQAELSSDLYREYLRRRRLQRPS